MKWTVEADALLRDLHAEKMPFGDIAISMSASGYHVTRNACIGRAHRLGLYMLPQQLKPKKPKPKRPRSPRPRRRIIMEPDREEIIREQRRAARTGLLIDFDPDQCRWPLEEISRATYRYCTEDQAHLGSAYCAAHHNIAHPRRHT